MVIANCQQCGGAVRLGGSRITVNRKHGCMHYIAHRTATKCIAADDYTCAAMKPYTKPAPHTLMMEKWNAANGGIPVAPNEPPL